MTSISLTTKTRLSPEKVFMRAETYFGDEYGLELTEQTEDTIHFEGGGGFVEIRAVPNGHLTDVDLSGREWTFELERFLQFIAF